MAEFISSDYRRRDSGLYGPSRHEPGGRLCELLAVNQLNGFNVGGRARDPLYSYTTLIVNWVGANNQTTFTDNSPLGHALTAHGDAKLTTANYKFSPSALACNGTDAYVTAADHAGFYLPVDHHVGYWVYRAATGTQHRTIGQVASGNTGWIGSISAADKAQYRVSSDGSAIAMTLTSTTTIASGAWYWIEFGRQGNDWSLGVNGVQEATTNLSLTPFNSTQPLGIAAQPDVPTLFHNGVLGPMRITKGVWRGFSLPTAMFPTS